MLTFIKNLFKPKSKLNDEPLDFIDPEVARHIASRNAEEGERIKNHRRAYEKHRGREVHPHRRDDPFSPTNITTAAILTDSGPHKSGSGGSYDSGGSSFSGGGSDGGGAAGGF